MVGVVIITHGELAKEFLKTTEMIVGEQPQMRAISVSGPVDDSYLCGLLKQSINEVNTGQGVLILTDMFGGTPSNISLSFLDDMHVEVVTGVNLPMLLKLADTTQNLTVRELKNKIVEYGRKNILVASDLLSAQRSG